MRVAPPVTDSDICLPFTGGYRMLPIVAMDWLEHTSFFATFAVKELRRKLAPRTCSASSRATGWVTRSRRIPVIEEHIHSLVHASFDFGNVLRQRALLIFQYLLQYRRAGILACPA
ncbi:hypothetical protein ABIC02_007658 [Bradyrhizobium sp. RT5a]